MWSVPKNICWNKSCSSPPVVAPRGADRSGTVRKVDRRNDEIHYYISSLPADATVINRAIRQHWHIENKLHWVLDVGFHEDQSRKRAGHAAQNFSLINRIVGQHNNGGTRASRCARAM